MCRRCNNWIILKHWSLYHHISFALLSFFFFVAANVSCWTTSITSIVATTVQRRWLCWIWMQVKFTETNDNDVLMNIKSTMLTVCTTSTINIRFCLSNTGVLFFHYDHLLQFFSSKFEFQIVLTILI